jgi:hypothetical protein
MIFRQYDANIPDTQPSQVPNVPEKPKEKDGNPNAIS